MGTPNQSSNFGVTPAALDPSPRFVWHVAACAPGERPMHLLQGAFLGADGVAHEILRTDLLRNGWGEVGTVALASKGPLPLPVRLAATWFSFAENQFYKGSFALPSARLLDLFQAGYTHPATRKQTPWDTLLAGLGPGGRLVLWVAGGGLTVEVCALAAAEVPIDWNATPLADAGPRVQYVGDILAEELSGPELADLTTNGATPERWDRYRTRWPWRPLLLRGSKSEDPADQPTLRLRTFNGECEFLTQFSAGLYPRAAPRRLELRYTGGDGIRRVAHIECDETETFAAFTKLRGRPGAAETLTLQLDTGDPAGGVRVYVCDDTYSLELLAAKVSVYRSA